MNPFRIAGVVQPPFFTDRAAELARVRIALSEPTAKLPVARSLPSLPTAPGSPRRRATTP